jgi:hypothetical protein
MCVCGPRRALHTPRVCSSSNPTAKRTHQVHCRGAFFRNGPFLTVQPWLSHLIAYLHSRGYPTSLHSRGTAVVIPPQCTFAPPWSSHLIAHLHSRGYPTSLHICTAVVIPPHCTFAQPWLSHLIAQPWHSRAYPTSLYSLGCPSIVLISAIVCSFQCAQARHFFPLSKAACLACFSGACLVIFMIMASHCLFVLSTQHRHCPPFFLQAACLARAAAESVMKKP